MKKSSRINNDKYSGDKELNFLSDDEYCKLSGRLKTFPKHFKALENSVNDKLGYCVDTDYCIDYNTKISDIEIKSCKEMQQTVIPITDKNLNLFLSCPKVLLKSSVNFAESEKNKHEIFNRLYIGLTSKGPVLFQIKIHTKYSNKLKKPDYSDYNLSFYVILNGKDHVHLRRFDSMSHHCHFPKFNKEGKLIKNVFKSNVLFDMAHYHTYDPKYTILFPSKKSIGHEDPIPCEAFQDIDSAIKSFEKDLGVIPENNYNLPENATIYDFCLRIYKNHFQNSSMCAIMNKDLSNSLNQ